VISHIDKVFGCCV